MHKTGNVVVEGVAIGKIQFLNADYEEQIKRYMTGTEEEEKKRYQEAHTLAKDDLDSLLEDRDSLSESEAEIIEAHQLMIDDITFEDAILGYVEQKMSAPSAVLKAVDDFKAMFEEIDDEYLRERQKDIVDVGNRLLRKLLHMKEFSVVGADVILCAKDIEPSIMAGLSEKQVKAILLGSGSKTSHTVIIAKAKGFVTMVGVELDETEIADGDDIIVDAVKGEIILKPSEEELSRYKEQVQKQEEQRKYLMGKAKQPAVTTDGKEILVSANISRPTDMEKAVEYGCHGVGLYRTEFLFMESAQLPDEEKQVAAYRSVAEQAGGNLCVIRTLDIGGDKHCDCLKLRRRGQPIFRFQGDSNLFTAKRHVQSAASQYLKSGTLWKTGDHDPNGYHVIGNLRDEAVDRRSQRRDAKRKHTIRRRCSGRYHGRDTGIRSHGTVICKTCRFFQYRYE